MSSCKGTVLLAVSGGIDSMYMAARAGELFPGMETAVAHCNFCLRGEESDGDEAFVREWCREHSVVCHVKRFDTRGYAKKRGISTEMAARELRYKWFEELRESFGYEAVAVAHNACDNAETLILNLLRGTGSKGIRGMERERDGVVRPILGVERAQIRQWMEERQLSWREDSSNADSSYKRNLIRNEVFPLFRKLNPSFIRTLNDDMRRFSEADDIAREYCLQNRQSVLSDNEGSILVGELTKLKHWKLVLWRLLEENGGTGSNEYASMLECIESGRQIGGKRFGAFLGAAGGRIILPSKEQPSKKILYSKTVRKEELPSPPIMPEGVIAMDAQKLKSPLPVRRWKSGDWMRPLGMNGGKKKISDILTELQLSVDEKDTAQVIELEGDHVAALLCERIDEEVKITDSCTEAVVLSYSESKI